ncbi:MAG: hypothetical protein KAH56_13895 [Candidatus Krumholzibacteria bacterium]|nr:hypothetical protein [Candidatus Krumholzibacteria bacterium]
MNRKTRIVLPLVLVLLLLGSNAWAQHGYGWEAGSGKTYDVELDLPPGPPIFRMTSEDSLHGKPKYDYFMLVKAKFNGVYDLEGGLQDQETFNVGKIDVWGNDNSNRYWTDMHQSQVRFRGQRETEGGTLVGYMEGDFWGGNKGYRLRHLWVDYKFVHFGQDWTFFGDKGIWPNVLDWDGPPSGVWRREPELKFYFTNDSHWQFDVGLGQPGAEVTLNIDPNSQVSKAYQPVPDFIGAVQKSGDFGHIRVTGIYRTLEYKVLDENQSEPGYGGTVSGFIQTSSVKTNPIQFQFYAGQGIATYVVSFSGMNFDAAEDGLGNMKSIPTYGGWAAYEHFFTPKWHANIVGGFSNFSSHAITAFDIPGTDPNIHATNTSIDLNHYYGLINIMYTPQPALTFAIELNLGNKESKYEGDDIDTGSEHLTSLEQSRSAQRISFGLFFDF